jgi:hypothetical protein
MNNLHPSTQTSPSRRRRWPLFLLALGLAGCGRQGGTVDPASWKTFTSEPGKFSVLLPGTPEEKSTSEKTAVGGIEAHFFTVEVNRKTAFTIVYNDYPGSAEFTSPQAVLEGAEKGALDGAKADYESNIKLGSHTGREFGFHRGEFVVKSRVFLFGHRLYQLISVHADASPHPEDVAKFMDSFSVKAD